MEKLIKNGDIILDGTATRNEKEYRAFRKLEVIEEFMEKHSIKDLEELQTAFVVYNTFKSLATKEINKWRNYFYYHYLLFH